MDEEHSAAGDRTGRGLLGIGGHGWWEVARRTWAESGEDNLGLVASGIAFNAFLAIIPLLTAVVLGYGLVASPAQVAGHIATLAQVMPQQAAEIIGGQLENMVETAGTTTGFGFVVTLAITLYGAIRGAAGIIVALNIVYDIEESRSFLWQTATALGITAGLVLIFILASLAITVVNFMAALLPDTGGALHDVLQAGYWLAAAAAVCVVLGLIYAYAPNRVDPDWRLVTPGSALATVIWIVATYAFSLYVQNFGTYNATYGALGAVIVFLLWLYLSAYILLLGAELNQVLERRAGKDEAHGPAQQDPPLEKGVHERSEVVQEAREKGGIGTA